MPAKQRRKPGDSITDPIFCASTFTFARTDDCIEYVEGRSSREEYGRYGNPNERSVEAQAGGARRRRRGVRLQSSGMAAIVGLLMAKLNAGDEIVFFDQCYHRSREFCAKHLARFGVVTRQVPTGDFAAMEAAITPNTKMLVSESPTNPHLTRRRSGTVRRDRQQARSRNADRRDFGDALQRAADRIRRRLRAALGHQVSGRPQRFAGRRDLRSQEKLEPVRRLRGIMGGSQSPHNLYLLERGLKTFELRMQRHNENGSAVAEFLGSPSAGRTRLLPRSGVPPDARRRPRHRCAASAA